MNLPITGLITGFEPPDYQKRSILTFHLFRRNIHTRRKWVFTTRIAVACPFPFFDISPTKATRLGRQIHKVPKRTILLPA